MSDWKQTIKKTMIRRYLAVTKIMSFEKPYDGTKPFYLLMTANIKSAHTMNRPL